MKIQEMKIETWKLENIHPYPFNAKLHDVNVIADSLKEFDVDQPIVVDKEGVIIKGHGRLEAAKKLGLKTFPVIVRKDLTEAQVKLARIVDNRSSEFGWNLDILKAELDGIGINSDELNNYKLDDSWLEGLGNSASLENLDKELSNWGDKQDNEDTESIKDIEEHDEKAGNFNLIIKCSSLEELQEIQQRLGIRDRKISAPVFVRILRGGQF